MLNADSVRGRGLGPGAALLMPAPRVSKMRVGVSAWYSPPEPEPLGLRLRDGADVPPTA